MKATDSTVAGCGSATLVTVVTEPNFKSRCLLAQCIFSRQFRVLLHIKQDQSCYEKPARLHVGMPERKVSLHHSLQRGPIRRSSWCCYSQDEAASASKSTCCFHCSLMSRWGSCGFRHHAAGSNLDGTIAKAAVKKWACLQIRVPSQRVFSICF